MKKAKLKHRFFTRKRKTFLKIQLKHQPSKTIFLIICVFLKSRFFTQICGFKKNIVFTIDFIQGTCWKIESKSGSKNVP